VQAEWCSALARVEYEDANEALTEIRNLGGEKPPTIGQLRVAALRVVERREADQRYKRRALEDKSPRTEGELTPIREMVDAFFKRQGTTREAVEKKLGWKK
jgi:CRISPR type IV-associated protein Csf3